MRSVGKSKKDELWLKALGARIRSLIAQKGYASEYEFWVEKVGDKISRGGLNFIVKGKTDPKATTLRILAKALRVDLSELFRF